jgi:hypothetical protein
LQLQQQGRCFHHMPGGATRGSVRLGLEAPVALAQVVQERDDGEPLLLRLLQWPQAGEAGQLQQRPTDERDIEAVVDERMTLTRFGQFAPRLFGSLNHPAHIYPGMFGMAASGSPSCVPPRSNAALSVLQSILPNAYKMSRLPTPLLRGNYELSYRMT